MVTVKNELRKIEQTPELKYNLKNYDAAVRLWYATLFDYFDPKVTAWRKRVALSVVEKYNPAMAEEAELSPQKAAPAYRKR